MTRPKGEKGGLSSSEIVAAYFIGTCSFLLLVVLVWAFLTEFGLFCAILVGLAVSVVVLVLIEGVDL